MSDFGAGIIVQMVGSIVGGMQQRQELLTQAGLAEYNAKTELQNAKSDEMLGELAQMRQTEAAENTKSTLETALASQGRVGGGVTDYAIRGKAESELEFENRMIGYETTVAAKEHTTQSKLDMFQVNMLKENAKRKLIGGFLNAAGYGAGAFSRMGSNNSQVNYRNSGLGSSWNLPQFGGGGNSMSSSGSSFQGFQGVNGTPTAAGTYYV